MIGRLYSILKVYYEFYLDLTLRCLNLKLQAVTLTLRHIYIYAM